MSTRYAAVYRSSTGRPEESEVARYLPGNYRVMGWSHEWVVIQGEDDHGWTLDDYVIPRLGSGLISAREISADTAIDHLKGGGGSADQEAES